MSVPETGLSIGEVIKRIFSTIQRRGLDVILVLNEIDYLINSYGDDILYQFTRAGERIAPGFLNLVGISNNLKFKEALDPRVLSSLGEEQLVFPPIYRRRTASNTNRKSISCFQARSSASLCHQSMRRSSGFRAWRRQKGSRFVTDSGRGSRA